MNAQINLVINALSAQIGGGQTYIHQLLRHRDMSLPLNIRLLVPPQHTDFLKVSGINVIPCHWADRSIIHRVLWERFILPQKLKEWKTDILYCPGGTLITSPPKNCKTIVAFRNMLAFEPVNIKQYPLGYMRFKLRLLYHIFLKSMSKADFTIFISRHGQSVIEWLLPYIKERSVCIPHGISDVFRSGAVVETERPNDLPNKYLLYVSKLHTYKHQIEVIQAYQQFRQQKPDAEKLLLVGPEYPWYGTRVRALINQLGLKDDVICTGPVPYQNLPTYYHHAEAIIFASTCENCPNVLLEAMGSGRPLFVSDRPPMTEFAEDGAIYFDPCSPDDLAQKLLSYLDNKDYLQMLGNRSFKLANQYSWENTARQTFETLLKVASI
jgi:glycosyltransferase involved in cell wall biosynthesis